MRRRAGLLAAALVLAAGCGGGAEPVARPEPLPAGAAFALAGRVVTEQELERTADALALLRPRSSRTDLLRRALVDHLLPREALALRHADARAEAERAARERAEALAAGTTTAMGVPWSGLPGDVDLLVWTAFVDGAAGEVLGPVESTSGSFSVLRVDEPYDPDARIDQRIAFTAHLFPFAPEPREDDAGAVDALAAFEGLELRCASPGWRELVPTALAHRLQVRVAGAEEPASKP